jgi:hypothetical protein
MSILRTDRAPRKGQNEKLDNSDPSSELKYHPTRGATTATGSWPGLASLGGDCEPLPGSFLPERPRPPRHQPASADDRGEAAGGRQAGTIPLGTGRANGAPEGNSAPVEPGGVRAPALAAPYLLAVPDFVQADWFVAMPRPCPGANLGRPKRGRQRIGGGLHWAIHQAVIVQKTSRVILPDVVLAQVLWGGERGNWPRNWRRRLVQRLKRAATLKTGLSKVVHREADLGESACPASCALHGIAVRHQHLEVTISTPAAQPVAAVDARHPDEPEFSGTFLGALEVFGGDNYPDRGYHWAPLTGWPEPEGEEYPDEKEAREAHERLLRNVKGLKHEGRLTAVYFPLKLFGSSAAVGLSWQQRQLHQAITRELTRGPGKARTRRPDRADILVGGQVPDEAAPLGVAPCPYLEDRGRYVGFNGNGWGRKRHLHGRGYRPLVWMRKAAYGLPQDGKSPWRRVRAFLRDLGRLGELFGLVVGAWHPRECAWRPLADLPPLTRTSAGRSWLRGCLLRVYTAEDFLVRWRQIFAARMGFSVIRDTKREQTVEPESATASRQAFLAFLGRTGVSPAELARQLGVSRSLVSRHLSGDRGWTASWAQRVAAWVAGQEGGVSGVSTHSL